MATQRNGFNKDDHVKIGDVYRRKTFGEKFAEFIHGVMLLAVIGLFLYWIF